MEYFIWIDKLDLIVNQAEPLKNIKLNYHSLFLMYVVLEGVQFACLHV